MHLLKKLILKFVTLVVMVALMSVGLRYARPYIMKAAGVPQMPGPDGASGPAGVAGVQFAAEESDLMSTVFKSALRLFSGQATRNELSSELSEKLYSGRAGAGEMSELGIELIGPDGKPTVPGADHAQPGKTDPANPTAKAGERSAKTAQGAKSSAKPGAPAGQPSAEAKPGSGSNNALDQLLARIRPYSIELTCIPVVFLGMFVVNRFRRRRSPEDAFMLPDLASIQSPADTEPYDMKHAVHSLKAEDFELLIALIYQRQGYRITMPAGLSGGRGGDFTLQRKSERILVQCKRLNSDHKIPVERVRELHEAVTAAGATRGMFVASCSFTWDARNFAKTKGMTLISARTLDELLTAARETPKEDLLAVSQWAPKLMAKVKLTPPNCPSCEAAMDEINQSNGSVWVCSQRPDCKGRRCARQHRRPVTTAAAPAAAKQEDEITA